MKNRNLIIVSLSLLLLSLLAFPYNAGGTGDLVLRPIGWKSSIPYEPANTPRKKEIIKLYEGLQQINPQTYGPMSLGDFASYMQTRDPEHRDYSVAFEGKPVLNIGILLGYYLALGLGTTLVYVSMKPKK